jgi:integrase
MAREIERLRVLDIPKLRAVPGRHADGAGLFLQVIGDTASWLLKFTSPTTGKPREMGLGSLRDVKLAKARELAKQWRELIAEGKDPIEVRRERERADRAESAKKIEFEKYARQYVADHKSKWRSAKHAGQWIDTLERYVFPKIGKKDIAAITSKDVLALLQQEWEAKTETMARVQGRVSNILDSAVADELRADNPAAWARLKFKLPSPRTLKRQRGRHFAALEIDQLPEFMDKLRGRRGVAALALEFLILTAARTTEARLMTDDEVNYDTRTWTVPGPRMKNGKEHRVPLCDRAIEILKSVPRQKGNRHFFAVTPVGGLSNMAMYSLAQDIAKAMDVKLTVHGFRAVFRSWAEERTSYPHSVIELALAHTQSDALMRAYQRSDLWERRTNLANDWAGFCSGRKSADIVPLRVKGGA